MPYMDAIGFDNSDIRGNQLIYFVTMHFIASANLHVMLKLWAGTQLEFLLLCVMLIPMTVDVDSVGFCKWLEKICGSFTRISSTLATTGLQG